jgi:hypothetical protein
VDIPLTTILVAIMFVTILSMGIGNLLGSLADIVNHASTSRRSRTHVSWIVLILLTHFALFWNTKEIVDVENWTFAAFLITVTGPVLLFFTTSILLSPPEPGDDADLDGFFARLQRPFFLMFACQQAWVLVVGYLMNGGWIPKDLLNGILVLLALVLGFSRSPALIRGGTIAAWALMGAALVVRIAEEGF